MSKSRRKKINIQINGKTKDFKTLCKGDLTDILASLDNSALTSQSKEFGLYLLKNKLQSALYSAANSQKTKKRKVTFEPIPENISSFKDLGQHIERITAKHDVYRAYDLLHPNNLAQILGIGYQVNAKKYALALSGGGAKGSFESGALLYLERGGYLSDVGFVAGTSVGAINALGVAAWGENSGEKIANLWLGLQSNSDMYRKTTQYRALQEAANEIGLPFNVLDAANAGESNSSDGINQLSVAQSSSLAGSALGLVFTPTPFGASLLAGSLAASIMTSLIAQDALEDLADFMKKLMNLDRAYSLSPTRKILEEVIPEADQFKLPLRIAFVSAYDGSMYYVDENALAHRITNHFPRERTGESFYIIDKSKKQALIRATIASSAIPLIFGSPALFLSQTDHQIPYSGLIAQWMNGSLTNDIDVHRCWDGGVRETTPIHAAVEGGYKDIIAISAGIRGMNTDSTFRFSPGPLGQDDIKFFDVIGRSIDIMTNEISENDKRLGSEEHNVHYIEPIIEIHNSYTIDPGLICINQEYGYMRAFNALEDIPENVLAAKDEPGGSTLYAAWLILAFTYTEEIAATRLAIHNLEIRGMNIYRNHYFRGWDLHILQEIRRLKRHLEFLYNSRIEAWSNEASLPYPLPDQTDMTDVVSSWEKHSPKHYHFNLIPPPFERQKIWINGNTIFENPDNI